MRRTTIKINNRNRAYENIQGVLSTLALMFGAVAAGVGIDHYMLKAEADLTAFGAEFYPTLFAYSLIGFSIVVVAKVWGHLAQNRFWLKIELSNNLHRIADRIDPRRH